jgi:NAD(P)H-dependent FMN reductase
LTGAFLNGCLLSPEVATRISLGLLVSYRKQGAGNDCYFCDRREHPTGSLFGKPAHWVLQHLKDRAGVDTTLLDLRDFPMPFFDQPVPPAMSGRAPYENEVVKRWTAEIARSDGFVFVTPQYNYGASAVLKNALDWVYPEWNRKAAAFVSYGGAAGTRSVQQLRETAIELQLAPIRSSVHIPAAVLLGALPRRRCERRSGGA